MKRWVLPGLFVLIQAITANADVPGLVVRADLDGPVDVVHTQYILRAMQRARDKDASLFLLVMDTPGGLGSSMSRIIKKILASPMPVAVFVYPPGARGASAGFFILISADIAAMAPGTRTGAAHPILSFGGMPIGGDTPRPKGAKDKKDSGGSTSILLEKVTQDILASIRSIAGLRGRNIDMCLAAVQQSKSYSDTEALKGKVIDLRANSVRDLLKQINGRKVKRIDGSTTVLQLDHPQIERVKMTARERFLALITNPNVAFLLGLAGLILLYVEITHTGLVIPGVAGALSLLLAIMGFSYLPISVTGVLLIVLAMGLFIAELKMPGFGILGGLGIVSLALGGIMLVKRTDLGVSVDVSVAIGAAAGFGVLFLFLSYLVLRSFRQRPRTGKDTLIGAQATALTDLSPRGQVLLNGEYWKAVASGHVPEGAPVRVVRVDGLTVYVEPIQEETWESKP